MPDQLTDGIYEAPFRPRARMLRLLGDELIGSPRLSAVDLVRGRFVVERKRAPRVVGYELDMQPRHSEQIPLPEKGGTHGGGGGGGGDAGPSTGGLLMREPWPVYGMLRVYADTSVIGGCEDDEFGEPSRRLIEKCARGEATLVVSSVTLDELEGAPPAVRAVLEDYDDRLEVIEATNEIENLADHYIESGALSQRMRSDALHIAAATVAGVDVLASWNFRHMVNLWRIRQYREVNRRMGYPPVEIRTPKELENDE